MKLLHGNGFSLTVIDNWLCVLFIRARNCISCSLARHSADSVRLRWPLPNPPNDPAPPPPGCSPAMAAVFCSSAKPRLVYWVWVRALVAEATPHVTQHFRFPWRSLRRFRRHARRAPARTVRRAMSCAPACACFNRTRAGALPAGGAEGPPASFDSEAFLARMQATHGD